MVCLLERIQSFLKIKKTLLDMTEEIDVSLGHLTEQKRLLNKNLKAIRKIQYDNILKSPNMESIHKK